MQDSFLLIGGGLQQHRYKHLAKDNDLAQVRKSLKAPTKIIIKAIHYLV